MGQGLRGLAGRWGASLTVKHIGTQDRNKKNYNYINTGNSYLFPLKASVPELAALRWVQEGGSSSYDPPCPGHSTAWQEHPWGPCPHHPMW